MFQNQPFKFIFFLVLAVPFLLINGCSADRRMANNLNKIFKNSKLNEDSQVGFTIAAPDGKKAIYEKNAHKYFTPASNAKLLTFYAALKIIPDSIPSLRYIERGDSLIFWGTGDPSFLQSRLKGVKAYNFLKNSGKKLFFAAGRYTGSFYGPGWAWDDYNDYYQAEINELPLMDNLAYIKAEGNKLAVSPQLFADCFKKDSLSVAKDFKVTRKFDSNDFEYPVIDAPDGYEQYIPYKTSVNSTLSLLADTLNLPVQLITMEMPVNAKTIYGMKTEEVLREMMLPSDNFIAEQLLLVCANQFQRDLNGAVAIDHINKEYLSALPDPLNWVDGSGLSRMNLVTPADMITLLSLIYKEVNNKELLFSLLPAGGKSGTLKNAYPKTNQPFVFGKTGSLSNNYNQSGYVTTKKGMVFLFSFMNNHFVTPTATVRNEMVRIMTHIHEKF